MEFTAVRSSPSPAFAGSLPLFVEESRRRPQLILVCRSRRTLAAIRGSPSLPFAINQPLFAASSSPPPFVAHVSPLVSPLAPPSSSSSPLVPPAHLHLRWSRPARLRLRWFRPVPHYPNAPWYPWAC